MNREDKVIKRLFVFAVALTAGCVFIALSGYLRARGLIRIPQIPDPWGNILLWVYLAFSILLSLDRGTPLTGKWGSRLRWARLLLLISCVAAVATVVYG